MTTPLDRQVAALRNVDDVEDERFYTVTEALPLLGMGRSKFKEVTRGNDPDLKIVRMPTGALRPPIRVKGEEIRRYVEKYYGVLR